jgi:cobalamin biosynthesis Mg chelatase CobN
VQQRKRAESQPSNKQNTTTPASDSQTNTTTPTPTPTPTPASNSSDSKTNSSTSDTIKTNTTTTTTASNSSDSDSKTNATIDEKLDNSGPASSENQQSDRPDHTARAPGDGLPTIPPGKIYDGTSSDADSEGMGGKIALFVVMGVAQIALIVLAVRCRRRRVQEKLRTMNSQNQSQR